VAPAGSDALGVYRHNVIICRQTRDVYVFIQRDWFREFDQRDVQVEGPRRCKRKKSILVMDLHLAAFKESGGYAARGIHQELSPRLPIVPQTMMCAHRDPWLSERLPRPFSAPLAFIRDQG
jgi:hypothetical protein